MFSFAEVFAPGDAKGDVLQDTQATMTGCIHAAMLFCRFLPQVPQVPVLGLSESEARRAAEQEPFWSSCTREADGRVRTRRTSWMC